MNLIQLSQKRGFKLTHRDMGPRNLYLGPETPNEIFIWQDPIPEVNHTLVSKADITKLKSDILNSGLSRSELIYTAWSSASTFRGSDKKRRSQRSPYYVRTTNFLGSQ